MPGTKPEKHDPFAERGGSPSAELGGGISSESGGSPSAESGGSASADSAPRGDATRVALIRAAIDMFGRDGFNAASTRAISEAAGVNQALISYHFGGKPGLYLAALRFIADSVDARMGPLVAKIEARLAADAADSGGRASRGPDAPGFGAEGRDPTTAADRAIASLHEFTDAFAGMLTSDESKTWARLILREQQDPSDGFEILYSGVMGRILGMTTRLVAHARGSDPRSVDCRLTALTIIGQVLIFRAGREAVLRQMGWKRISDKERRLVRAELRRNVTAILRAEN